MEKATARLTSTGIQTQGCLTPETSASFSSALPSPQAPVPSICLSGPRAQGCWPPHSYLLGPEAKRIGASPIWGHFWNLQLLQAVLLPDPDSLPSLPTRDPREWHLRLEMDHKALRSSSSACYLFNKLVKYPPCARHCVSHWGLHSNEGDKTIKRSTPSCQGVIRAVKENTAG